LKELAIDLLHTKFQRYIFTKSEVIEFNRTTKLMLWMSKSMEFRA